MIELATKRHKGRGTHHRGSFPVRPLLPWELSASRGQVPHPVPQQVADYSERRLMRKNAVQSYPFDFYLLSGRGRTLAGDRLSDSHSDQQTQLEDLSHVRHRGFACGALLVGCCQILPEIERSASGSPERKRYARG
jgi:hypothetical protein